MQKTGIVIIGRNEGERLKRCIESLLSEQALIVYVDSGSDDGSVEYARQQQLGVVELDSSIPFSAARARNEGMQLLLEQSPKLAYIQFIDGDCEVVSGWLEYASQRLDDNDRLAVVCGRRRERYPERSIYNHLCDMEWNTPIGVANSCGGDSMARVDALVRVGGFNPEVIAGEEPDLCYRLRELDWIIERLDVEMTLHDARIVKFSQWWKRTLRSGHAYVHNMVLHWGGAQKFNVKNVLSILFWGGAIPTLFFTALFLGYYLIALLLLVVYVFMSRKIANYLVRVRGFEKKESWQYGFYTMIGKIPQMFGVLQFVLNSVREKSPEIIEYKIR